MEFKSKKTERQQDLSEQSLTMNNAAKRQRSNSLDQGITQQEGGSQSPKKIMKTETWLQKCKKVVNKTATQGANIIKEFVSQFTQSNSTQSQEDKICRSYVRQRSMLDLTTKNIAQKPTIDISKRCIQKIKSAKKQENRVRRSFPLPKLGDHVFHNPPKPQFCQIDDDSELHRVILGIASYSKKIVVDQSNQEADSTVHNKTARKESTKKRTQEKISQGNQTIKSVSKRKCQSCLQPQIDIPTAVEENNDYDYRSDPKINPFANTSPILPNLFHQVLGFTQTQQISAQTNYTQMNYPQTQQFCISNNISQNQAFDQRNFQNYVKPIESTQNSLNFQLVQNNSIFQGLRLQNSASLFEQPKQISSGRNRDRKRKRKGENEQRIG